MGRLIAADPELLAVVVKAPQHKAAMPIIEAGKDLYIEWPVGVGLQESVRDGGDRGGGKEARHQDPALSKGE